MSELSKILTDPRFEKLFKRDNGACALRLWFLQSQNGEDRLSFLYGFAMPSNFKNSKCNASNSKFKNLDGIKARVVTLSLFCSSEDLQHIVQALAQSKTLDEAMSLTEITWSQDYQKQFGGVILGRNLIIKPMTILPDRLNKLDSRLSSILNVCSTSCFICNLDKKTIFEVNGKFIPSIAQYCIEQLNKDLKLQFHKDDHQRLGELELIAFPTLNNIQQSIFGYKNEDNKLRINLELPKNTSFNFFQVRLELFNNGCLIHSYLSGGLEIYLHEIFHTVDIDKEIWEICDKSCISIYAKTSSCDAYYLYVTHSERYIREIHSTIEITSYKDNLPKLDLGWVYEHQKKGGVKQSLKPKVALKGNNLNISRTARQFREKDPWIISDREIESQLSRLPIEKKAKSNSLFFPKWEQGEDSGRVGFVKWFANILDEDPNSTIYLFDPYFEDVGLKLLAINTNKKPKYIIYTTGADTDVRIDRLKNECNILHGGLKGLDLKIYIFPNGAFHDRYVIVGKEQSVGYHLSNSIQMACENNPMLVTPIPEDTLIDLVNYSENFIYQQIEKNKLKGNKSNNSDFILYDAIDTTQALSISSRFEPLAILNQTISGNVLSELLSSENLKGISGEELKSKLSELGALDEGHLVPDYFNSLKGVTPRLITLPQTEFNDYWDMLGNLLANIANSDEASLFSGINDDAISTKLSQFVIMKCQESAASDNFSPLYFLQSDKKLQEFLANGERLENYSRHTPSNIDGYGIFYAIKALMHNNREKAVRLFEELIELADGNQMASQAIGVFIERFTILVLFASNEELVRDLLVSRSPFLKYVAFEALKVLVLNNNVGMIETCISDPKQQVEFIAWFVTNSNLNEGEPSDLQQELTNKLLNILPNKLSEDEFEQLLYILKGRMKTLRWKEPWLTNSIIMHLVNQDKINFETASNVYFVEFKGIINNLLKGTVELFRQDKEGLLVNITAYYLSNSGIRKITEVCLGFEGDFAKVERVIRKPLARFNHYSEWDSAVKAALLIYGLCIWMKHYLQADGKLLPKELIDAMNKASDLKSDKSDKEWECEVYSGGEYNFLMKKPE
jgi:hypothetical protein